MELRRMSHGGCNLARCVFIRKTIGFTAKLFHYLTP